MVAIHHTHRRRNRRTTDRVIVGATIAVLTALAATGAGYVWNLALTRPIAADRVAYGEAAVAVLVLGLLAVYPFAGLLLELARGKKRRTD